jgi:hypothetical protein
MRITGRQLRRIIQEEVSRMMNEADAPDVNRRNIALLTTIANGKVITDANATTDENLTINAMLDLYITKRKPALAALAANTLPGSPFARKLRAVQAELGIKVDGAFGVDSIMGIVRSVKDPSIDDILDILTPSGGEVPRTATVADLAALIDQGNKGNKRATDLGPGLVGSTGTGSLGVEVTPVKISPSSPPQVVRSAMLRIYTPARLTAIKRTALTMQARGDDAGLETYLRSELGANSKELGAMRAELLLAALGIKPGDSSSALPPAPAPLEERRRMLERKSYRS